jgi:hypothetical protein
MNRPDRSPLRRAINTARKALESQVLAAAEQSRGEAGLALLLSAKEDTRRLEEELEAAIVQAEEVAGLRKSYPTEDIELPKATARFAAGTETELDDVAAQAVANGEEGR